MQQPPPVIVALVTKEGCPACIAFRPKWERAIARYPALTAANAIFELDVMSRNPHVNAFLDRAGVTEVPAVVIAPRGDGYPRLLVFPDDWTLHEHLVAARRMVIGH